MKVRIGIDVGGTFTDAIAINNETLEIIGFVKVLTTHNSKDGVATGIIDAISKLISTYNINPCDITLIACGTTQATNALLEGDVACVGVIYVSSHNISKFKDIHLSENKYIKIKTYHIKPDDNFDINLKKTLSYVSNDNIKTIVASCAFSPDNSTFEEKIVDVARKSGIYATATCEISQLYGIKVRTNTAIINACLLPKMVKTFDLIKLCIENMHISAPIMIMRCDGGVMSIDEIKKRPFLTILSGPAASVYGALIHEKISNGIFLEVGGTSTDISVIKNGTIMSKHAQIGKHKLYLNSLDIHTIAVAGGSMIKISNGNKLDIGPRSAHIAGLEYCCFCNPDDLCDISLTYLEVDGESYIGVKNSHGKNFAITLTCICNALSLVNDSDYSYGNREASKLAISKLAQFFNTTIYDICNKILAIAVGKCIEVINPLVLQYNINLENFTIFGGGGASSILVPFVAGKLNCSHKICQNAQVISTIGVCLSMLREVVEKTVFSPKEQDIKNLKLIATSKLSASFANPDLIETHIEFDKNKNILRAIATSSVDLSYYNKTQLVSDEQLTKIALSYVKGQNQSISTQKKLGKYLILQIVCTKKILFGLLNNKATYSLIIDIYGIVRFCEITKNMYICTSLDILTSFENVLKQNYTYTDAGCLLPKCIVVLPNKILDLSTCVDIKQMLSIIKDEINFDTLFDIVILIF